MSKKLNKITALSTAAILASSAIVPVAASAASPTVADITHVVFTTDSGQLVSLEMNEYDLALAGKALSESPTHIALYNGEAVYTMVDYDNALTAAKGNISEALEILIENEESISDKVVSGEIVDGKVVGTEGEETPAEDLAVESVKAINDNTVTVTFNKAIEAASADNFKVEGLSVTGAALSEDKKTVTLKTTTATAGNTYNLTIAGLMIAGEEQPEMKATYTVMNASAIYGLEMTTEGDVKQLDAENGKSVLVEVKVLDNKGEYVQDGEVEVEFDSTFGSFAEKRVTVQNGVAKVLFQSETLTEERTATLTAVVKEATNTNLIGLKQEINLVLTPVVAGEEKEEVGAQLIDITANQAERIVLHFNKEVDAKELNAAYLPEKGKAQKFFIDVANDKVQDIEKNRGPKKVRGFKAVPGNNKAVYAIFEKTDYLHDNEYVTVKVRDERKEITGEGIATKVLTDFRDPAMLDVQVSDLKTLKVVFSEPVHDNMTEGELTSATNKDNWVLDGNKLSATDIWGEGAKVEVGEFDPKTGEDNRHIATITLGKDVKGEQVYFKPGKHTIQGANIGDWANLTDTAQNTLNTQTLKFEVPVDNEAPKAEVLVQSPEQYIVKFDKTLGKELKASDIKLQKRVVDADGKVSWVEPTITVDGKEETQQIRVLQLANNEYKVEVKKDWTQVYNTKQSNLNYYNDTYRLFIAEGKVTTAGNGVKNAEQSLVLGGAMTTPDTTSPVIEDYKFNANTQSGVVIMSEPVKFPTGGDKLHTPSQAQGNEIPQPTADFIGKDKDGKIVTIPAKPIENRFHDNYDMQFVVEPSKELTPGDWQIVVRSISDDIGNTAASTTFDFTVDQKDAEVIEGKFAVAWTDAHTFKEVEGKPAHGNASDDNPEKGFDVVHVKFTKPVATTGEEGNALRTTAYTVNGKKLPSGSKVIADIAGHDDHDNVVDSVTILLPKETITNPASTTITVSPELLTADGTEKITNGGLHKLPTNTLYAAAVKATEKAEAQLNKAVADAKEVPNKDDKYDLVDLIKAGEKAQQQVKEALIQAQDAYASNDKNAIADAKIALLEANNAADKADKALVAATELANAKEELAALIDEAKEAGVAKADIEAAEKALDAKNKEAVEKAQETLQEKINEKQADKTTNVKVNKATFSEDDQILTLTFSEPVDSDFTIEKGLSLSLGAKATVDSKVTDVTFKGTVAEDVEGKNVVKIKVDPKVTGLTDKTVTLDNVGAKDAITLKNFDGTIVKLTVKDGVQVNVLTKLGAVKAQVNALTTTNGEKIAEGVTQKEIDAAKKAVKELEVTKDFTAEAKEKLYQDVLKAEKLLEEVEAAEKKLTGNEDATIDADTLASLAKREGVQGNEITITGAGTKTITADLDKLTVQNKDVDVIIAENVTVGTLEVKDAAKETITINGTVTNMTISDPNGVRVVVGETGEVTEGITVAKGAGKVAVEVAADATKAVTVTKDGKEPVTVNPGQTLEQAEAEADADQEAVDAALEKVEDSYEAAEGTEDTAEAKIAAVKEAVETDVDNAEVTVEITEEDGTFTVTLTKGEAEATKEIEITIAEPEVDADQEAVDAALEKVEDSYEAAEGTEDTAEAKIAAVKEAVETDVDNAEVTVEITEEDGTFTVTLTKGDAEATKDITITIAE